MKKREITATGLIDTKGALQMYMGELKEFFKMWKGARVFARFQVVEHNSSEALKAYYYHGVVPAYKAALWENGERMTEEQTELHLRYISPVMHEQIPNIETGKYTDRVREINEISNAEFVEHIEFIKQYAAENLYLFIEDPKEF